MLSFDDFRVWLLFVICDLFSGACLAAEARGGMCGRAKEGQCQLLTITDFRFSGNFEVPFLRLPLTSPGGTGRRRSYRGAWRR